MAGEVQGESVSEDDTCWFQLEEYRLLLIKNIEPSLITPYLRQCQVISPEDEEQIFNDPTLVIRRRKVGALLDILYRTGVKGYTAFLESLELDYPQLYKRITGKEPNKTFSILLDTAGESGLTQFMMSEVSRLQRALQEMKRQRQEAYSVSKDQEEWSRQQQLRERELRKMSEHVEKAREEREALDEELKQLREHNYILMTDLTALSQQKSNAVLTNRDLQLEIERLKHSLLAAESDTRLARRRTVTLRSAMEQRPSQDALLSLQRHNMMLSARVKELETQRRSQPSGLQREPDPEEVTKQEEKREEQPQHLDLLSTIFKLRRGLHRAEGERDKNQEEKEEAELHCARLKGDARMYKQRNEETLRQLEEVSKERDKALASRAELHAESCSLLQDKDQYRQQVRQLAERSDRLQLQLFRSRGEELHLQTRLRRLACSQQQGEPSHSQSSEEDNTETKGSNDVPSETSGEKKECAELQRHHTPLADARETREHPCTAAPWETDMSNPGTRPKFFYRRKQALRSKVIGKARVPGNLDDSSASDITDSDGM